MGSATVRTLLLFAPWLQEHRYACLWGAGLCNARDECPRLLRPRATTEQTADLLTHRRHHDVPRATSRVHSYSRSGPEALLL